MPRRNPSQVLCRGDRHHAEWSKIMRLAGKTVLVTGGTSGIGLASASVFFQNGARVAVTGQSAESVSRAKALFGPDFLVLQADVRSLAELTNAAKRVELEFGKLDILFANAGVAFATPLDSVNLDAYDLVMDINVKGVFQTVKAFAPIMSDGGSIILNTSWLNEVGTPGLSALSASKAAVRSFARTLSAELLPRKIRVNAVSPGAMNTPIHSKTGMSPDELNDFAARLQTKIPLGRFGEAQDIAQAALFLASDESAYMLGAEIVVDGGFSGI
jgi:NAD(P)-dependent dehydrogenase (short-subunit alcohol dehydrogenase family)